MSLAQQQQQLLAAVAAAQHGAGLTNAAGLYASNNGQSGTSQGESLAQMIPTTLSKKVTTQCEIANKLFGKVFCERLRDRATYVP